MNNDALILSLKNKVKDALIPMIKGKKCVLLEVPYYDNTGDTLIWQGTEDLLRENGIKPLYTKDLHAFKFPKLDSDTVILLQGGGNFGDLWPAPHKFRTKVIAKYPNNKIIILPQSVWFDDKEKMVENAKDFAKHPDLTIFARDKQSFDILTEHYHANKIVLTPDMAFCVDFKRFRKQMLKPSKQTLLMMRGDKELNDKFDFSKIAYTEKHDWPSFEEPHNKPIHLWGERIHYRLPSLYDWYWREIIKPYYIKQGVKMLSQYESVISTRLHGYILCLLLGKPVSVIDNSYGKNRSLYDTWLKDAEGITFIDK